MLSVPHAHPSIATLYFDQLREITQQYFDLNDYTNIILVNTITSLRYIRHSYITGQLSTF